MIEIEIPPRIPLSGQDRRDARMVGRINTDEKLAHEEIDPYDCWVVYDSPLNPSRDNSFDSDFNDLIPESYSTLGEYIEDFLIDKKGQALGIEYGGTGSLLFGSFTKNFFQRTAAVALVDKRPGYISSLDRDRNHSLIEGNFLSGNLKKEVNEWRNDREIDFLISRMGAGTLLLPQDPFLLASLFQEWYQSLSNHAIMFVQIPEVFQELLSSWSDLVDRNVAKDQLEIEISSHRVNWRYREEKSFLKLIKYENAPEKLPLLSFRDVYRIVNSK